MSYKVFSAFLLLIGLLFCLQPKLAFSEDTDELGSTIVSEDGAKTYYDVNFENLSKSYWFMSMHDVNDNDAVDEFARIHYCDAYENYFRDDFQWQRIRHSVREEIQQERGSYPFRYYSVSPLYLDRYDFDSKQFTLTPQSALNNVNTIDGLGPRAWKPYCGRNNSTKYYPNRVYIKFEDPINFTSFPMTERNANDLIMRMNEAGNQERLMFLEMRFRISGYTPVVERATVNILTLRARLEEIRIYEDAKRTKLIYKQDVDG